MSERIVENWGEVGRILEELVQAERRVELVSMGTANPKMAWGVRLYPVGEPRNTGKMVYGESATQAMQRTETLFKKGILENENPF